MAVYSIWNNKGGVGKSYLTFQIACEYARTNRDQKVLVIDMCPQANSSSMILGGMINGENALNAISSITPRMTIAGYIRERIASPYHNPGIGGRYPIQVATTNPNVPGNLYLVVGDEELELLTSRVSNATLPGPDDAWAKVHMWIRDIIYDISDSWNIDNLTVFIDCNPSFGIYTELALSASDRIIIPFSADGSSKRAVRAVLALLYGNARLPGAERSEYDRKSERYKLRVPRIYCYVGNRLTQANFGSARAFRTVVTEIGEEIYSTWRVTPGNFHIHPSGSPSPATKKTFREMFQFEVVDANSASVVSGALGIPIVSLTAGSHIVAGRSITVNQTQLDRQQPNICELVSTIE
ncbi:MAG: ParA family protein [Syntrophobacteraceae bacterium]|nr:ParA family protein [Syntrophobacteraceae bacterium]